MGQPVIIADYDHLSLFVTIDFLSHPLVLLSGMILILFSYMGTFWCYIVLGHSWRMGIRKDEKTVLIKDGPYHFVRHPIYLFQILMLMGVSCLLPTLFSLIILLVHLLCASVKALDEETYLLSIYGSEYENYLSTTGRFLPKCRSIQDL